MQFILKAIETIFAGFFGMLTALIKSVSSIYKVYSAVNMMSFGYLLCVGIGLPTIFAVLINCVRKKL